MPLYEYQCEACGHRFEVIQKFSDSPLETCPKCNGAVRKLLSSPAIQFKGSGWYITDYGRGGKPDGTAPKSESTSSTDSGGTASTEKKTETKTETKVESKPETKPASS